MNSLIAGFIATKRMKLAAWKDIIFSAEQFCSAEMLINRKPKESAVGLCYPTLACHRPE